MASIREKIEGLLDGSETCSLAAELVLCAGDRRDPCAIALITSRAAENEHALLLMSLADEENAVPANIFPLTTDLVVKVNGENQIEIAFRRSSQILCFEAPNSPAMWDIITALTKASQASQASATNSANTATVICERYRTKFGLTHVEKGIQSIDSAMSQPMPLSSGSAGQSVELLRSSHIRQQWINKQMRFRESLFTSTSPATMFVGTWNVNEKKIDDLATWLQPNLECDVVAVGLQEIDMTAGALVTQETANGKYWEDALTANMARAPCKYVRLCAKQLVGIMLVVFVKQEHVPHVKNLQTKYQAVGMMGIMGNKGGVALRMDFYETSICLVTAHLAAHMGHVSRRNQNFADIIQNLSFSMPVAEHDMVFFFGDLNYRIMLADDECKSKIIARDWDYLLKNDQLTVEKSAGRVFQGFAEAKIGFAPTYKYDPNTDVYDTSEKRRVPAYTDRILWKARSESMVQLRKYDRSEIRSSDHRPVFATFTLEIRKIIPARYDEVYREVIKSLDKMENEMLPECELSRNAVEFGSLYFDTPSTEIISIVNTGQVVVEYLFVPNPEETRISKPWLSVAPVAGMILPGEKADIRLTVNVNKFTAPPLNTGKNDLSDILILHLKNGRDHFVSVGGKFNRSSFGNSLDALVGILGSVRTTEPPSYDSGMPSNSKRLKVPKELWRLLDYMFRNGMDEEDLFEDPGDPDEIRFLRERLDMNESFDTYKGSVHSVATCLLRFLDSLSPPVIPPDFAKRALDASSSATASKQLIAKLPAVHFNVFHYVMAFLRELLAHAARNGLTAERVAYAFAAVLMRGDGSQSNSINFKKRAQFLMHFLRDVQVSEGNSDGEMLLAT